MAKPIIAVLGASGSQGGGVLAALVKQGIFTVRAVTRSAAKAQKLAQQDGVEAVVADMGDKAALVKVSSLPCSSNIASTYTYSIIMFRRSF